MELKTFDDEAFVVDAETYFHLWCCDCNLRHLVILDAMGKEGEKFKQDNGKIAIAMTRDQQATELAREKDNIKVLIDGEEIGYDKKKKTQKSDCNT